MILLDLLLTLVVYLIAPFIYIVKTDGTTVKKAKKYALINSICGFLFFTILYVALGSDSMAGMPVAVLYYFIAKSMMTSTEEKERLKEEKEKADEFETLMGRKALRQDCRCDKGKKKDGGSTCPFYVKRIRSNQRNVIDFYDNKMEFIL